MKTDKRPLPSSSRPRSVSPIAKTGEKPKASRATTKQKILAAIQRDKPKAMEQRASGNVWSSNETFRRLIDEIEDLLDEIADD